MRGRFESCRAVAFASRIGKVGIVGTSSLVVPVKTGAGESGAKRYHELKTKAKMPKGG
jgi:hypothetical protein